MAEQEQIKALVVEAMFQSIEKSKRDELVKLALAGLLKENYTGYGGREAAPLQRMYQSAVEDVARAEVKALFQGDTPEALQVRAAVHALAAQAISKVIGSEGLVDHVAQAISEALTRERR